MKMFTIIHEFSNVAKAQAIFEERVIERATLSNQIKLGYQGGGKDVDVHFIRPLNFWVGFADSGNRYWNALGIGNPFSKGSTIIAEINPPKSGINRRISGAFIEDGKGQVYLAHRGKIGGGRKGIGKKAFMSWYQGAIDLVKDGTQYNEMIIIGALDDKNLIKKLAAFTKIVSIFKDAVVSGVISKGSMTHC